MGAAQITVMLTAHGEGRPVGLLAFSHDSHNVDLTRCERHGERVNAGLA